MTLNPMYQPGTEPRGAEEASEAVSPAEEGATAQPRAPANTPLAAQAAPAAPAAWSEVKQALRSKASSRAPSAPQSPHKEGEAGAATKPGSPVMEPEAQSDADGDDESLELEARDALERELVRRAEGADEAVEGPAPSEDAAPATPVIGEECAPGEVEGPAWNVRGALVAYAIVVLPVRLCLIRDRAGGVRVVCIQGPYAKRPRVPCASSSAGSHLTHHPPGPVFAGPFGNRPGLVPQPRGALRAHPRPRPPRPRRRRTRARR